MNFSKQLNFPKSPIKTNIFKNQIEVVVTNHCDDHHKLVPRKDILINTPVKGRILRNGLAEDTSLNILGRGGFGKVVRALYAGNIFNF